MPQDPCHYSIYNQENNSAHNFHPEDLSLRGSYSVSSVIYLPTIYKWTPSHIPEDFIIFINIAVTNSYLARTRQVSVTIFFFFFYFFYCLHNPRWVSVCSTVLFHSCLSSTFAIQTIIFILCRSSSTWSIHFNLGLPNGLVLYGVHSVIFLVVLVFSILITWVAHLSLCDFINFIISSTWRIK